MTNKRKQRNALTDILYTPKKDMDRPMNPLARMVRVIFSDLNVRPPKFYMMLNQWLNDPQNGFNQPEKRSSERGNLQKELAKNSITWKTLSKLISVLNPKRVKLVLVFEWHDDSITSHEVVSTVVSSSGFDMKNMIMQAGTVTKYKPQDRTEFDQMLDALDDDSEASAGWHDEEDDYVDDD